MAVVRNWVLLRISFLGPGIQTRLLVEPDCFSRGTQPSVEVDSIPSHNLRVREGLLIVRLLREVTVFVGE